MGRQREREFEMRYFVFMVALILCGTADAAQGPPTRDVTVTNDASNPVPVTGTVEIVTPTPDVLPGHLGQDRGQHVL